MSYLQFPRLAFSGLFQADVSTVNNDPRHFDIDHFDSSFQEFQSNSASGGTTFNGWWNPVGTGIFRFHECATQSISTQAGQTQTKASQDPAIGLTVGNAMGRASGKLVDLDPDWQNASCLYGLGVTLINANGHVIMSADYASNPFRDLWFTRANSAGDMGASAMFQSVLTNVIWNLDGIQSPFFDQLIAATEQDMLSIRLTTYGYNMNAKAPLFGYGTVLGVIGAAKASQPRSFILGRRFTPTTQNAAMDLVSSNGIGCFSAQIDSTNSSLHVDLSNALPLAKGYVVQDLGPMQFALLKNPLTAQDDVINAEDYIALAAVDQSQELQLQQGGIQSVPLPTSINEDLHNHPLAILSAPDANGKMLVSVRENLLGLEVRADTFAFRLDPNDPHKNHAQSTFYAACYGIPMPNAALGFWVSGPALDYANTPVSAPPGTTPKALLPVNNVPDNAIRFSPARPVTDAEGKVQVQLHGPEEMQTPREYIDGQLYTISYNFAGNDPALQQTYDKLAAVVFTKIAPCPSPTWEDIYPILKQYANLYPIMSQGLLDFSKKEQADANAFILHFVFDKHIDDPDQMPVTRDLSSAKRTMLIRYFQQIIDSQGMPKNAMDMFGKRCPTRGGGGLAQAHQQSAATCPNLPGKSRGPNN
ncbi:hypothetical protein S2091_1812 [Solimicrobium silvestre]|uniref:Uncharacterized protein n=2 Tax=Solimicrobium silvestre TaxID=2099400 RepID=A0A2S9H0B8_9BURK|nr:hypothetical protein S2091_1812 [Solimicrobium silvestre]